MKFHIITLGCKVNTYESNVIADILKNNGYIEGTKEESDITIINTCTVTNTADNKSIKMIKHIKKENPNTTLIVVGCLPQTNLEKLKDIEGIAIILGNIGKSKIIEYINEYKQTKKTIIDIQNITEVPFETMKLNNFNHTRAFVKIQDGCNNYCSYCIIPYARGNVRSKKKENIIEEIKHLVNQGHLEIVLTGIHTGHYGSDLKEETFHSLLTEITKIEGLKRLRISSIEMNEITPSIIELMKQNKVLVDHMHIPIQSGSNTILKLMNRKYTKEEFIHKIEQIRKIRPNISITTDLIVGFPNETEELFNETIETINKIKFTKIHVFPFSKRNGTVAAEMDNQIEETVKKQRVKKILELSKQLETEYMKKQIGKQITYLPEIIKENNYIGHTGNYLLVKQKITDNCLKQERTGTIKKVEYPYVIVE